jgi:hypothetical protein
MNRKERIARLKAKLEYEERKEHLIKHPELIVEDFHTHYTEKTTKGTNQAAPCWVWNLKTAEGNLALIGGAPRFGMGALHPTIHTVYARRFIYAHDWPKQYAIAEQYNLRIMQDPWCQPYCVNPLHMHSKAEEYT